MAGTRTGTASIIVYARKICRLVHSYGATDLGVRATPEIAAAVEALVVACDAFNLLDDFPGQTDNTGATEDIDIGGANEP